MSVAEGVLDPYRPPLELRDTSFINYDLLQLYVRQIVSNISPSSACTVW